MTVFLLRTRTPTHARRPRTGADAGARPPEDRKAHPVNRPLTAACAVALLVAAPSACSLTESNEPPTKGRARGTINVESSADACDLTTTKAPVGQRRRSR